MPRHGRLITHGATPIVGYKRYSHITETHSVTQRVPVLSPAQIANLPAGHVMVIRRGMPASVGRVQMAWKRRDIKRANRGAQWPVHPTSYADDDANVDEP
jgi:hypothetical protein